MSQSHSYPCHTLPNSAFTAITHLPLPLCSFFLSQCLGCRTPRTCHTAVALSRHSHMSHPYRVWLFVLWCTALYRTLLAYQRSGWRRGVNHSIYVSDTSDLIGKYGGSWKRAWTWPTRSPEWHSMLGAVQIELEIIKTEPLSDEEAVAGFISPVLIKA